MTPCLGTRFSGGAVSSRMDGRLLKTWCNLDALQWVVCLFWQEWGGPQRIFTSRMNRQCCSLQRSLCAPIKQKRSEIADRSKLHHNNTPAHTVFVMTVYLVQIGFATFQQSQFEPGRLFPVLKAQEKPGGHHFENVSAIQGLSQSL